ncbi:MAG: ComEA family DNA-binding protein [Deltaproteobacteria bacterium]|nr:ComEA family DNA-binding protein [Deltaproteobacteria bacterium]
MAVKDADKFITINAKDQSQNIALLIIAVFLAAIYFLNEFYIHKEPAHIATVSSAEQAIVEIEDSSGNSKVYVLPKEKSEIKNGSKITINKDGSADTGFMSGEKRLIFAIPLNINKATAQDFEALPGIGPNLAEKIIETRKRLDGFKTVDDLKKVKGIGEKKIEKVREMISVG